ncbi:MULTISPECIES: hypothetical protein [Dehalobacter]|uniref:Recombinase n=1 Tax=Dehalobacter restrictus TaxID=55583 RepID=A0A857DJR9_9FIRM|nr:hypothetical protein [Dehalobacter restrictus]QHA01063.1 hypothetical protein GQ588_10680 [Dehalobacter restrictus]UWG95975.1 hypothetical protein LPY66_13790 [Dehalobacter sp. DCM]
MAKSKNTQKNEKPSKIVFYMRVGSIEQLSPEAQKEYLGKKPEEMKNEEFRKGDN